MTSLVERLRVRSDRRPIYSLKESDNESLLAPQKYKAPLVKLEKIVQHSAQLWLFPSLGVMCCFCSAISQTEPQSSSPTPSYKSIAYRPAIIPTRRCMITLKRECRK